MCSRYDCPECGDRLIHQMNRGPKESSSAFGQWVYDKVPHHFDFVDLDGIVYRRSTRVLYFVEEKHGSGLSDAQRFAFPILERAVELLIADGMIDPRSAAIEINVDWDRDASGLALRNAVIRRPVLRLGAFPVLDASTLSALLTGRIFLGDVA